MNLQARLVAVLVGFVAAWQLDATSHVQAWDPMRAPSEELQRRNSQAGQGRTIGGLGEVILRVFRDVISHVDGTRCDMYPTCSQYAVEAARRHGSVLGVLLFVDRLFHEWSESTRAPLVLVHGRKRFWDPLDANDFWLRDSGRPRSPEAP